MKNVFISSTTADLKKVRQHVLEVVLQQGCYPIVEEGFRPEAHDVSAQRTIELKLRAADAVICLVGFQYGGEPAHPARNGSRRSWTQIEFDVAKRLGLKTLVCLTDPKFYRGRMPRETGSKREQREKKQLQQLHYETIEKGAGWFYKFSKPADLSATVAGFLRHPQKNTSANDDKRLLFVGAQKGTGGGKYQDLDLKGQLKATKAALKGKRIEVSAIFDATPLQIIAKINQVRPHILHISGAQEAGCIKLHDEQKGLVPFDAEKLADLIAESNDGSLRLVVLDTCYSMQQAKRLTDRGVPYAIGIYDAISDEVATEFYTAFYGSLAAEKTLTTAVHVASKLVLGHASADPKWLKSQEEILDMKFDWRIHVPDLSAAADLDASKEKL